MTENRTKWRKKRKRESHKRQSKRHDEDDEDNDSDDDRDDNDSDDQFRSPNAPPNTDSRVEIEVVSRDGVQISRFPPAIRRTVTRPHAAVTAAIAALESGRGHSQHGIPVLENVSHGQLQASSTVSADCLGGLSFVAALPPVMKGSGVVKRFGTRVLVVPMHSGSSLDLNFFFLVSEKCFYLDIVDVHDDVRYDCSMFVCHVQVLMFLCRMW